MAKEHTRNVLFDKTFKEPAIISWSELSSPNEANWRWCKIGFGLARRAVRCFQESLGDGELSAPMAAGISIAGGLQLALPPADSKQQVRDRLIAHWSPAVPGTLHESNHLFAGNFGSTGVGPTRRYFTDTASMWTDLEIRLVAADLPYFHHLYYAANTSMWTQLSAVDSNEIGPLARVHNMYDQSSSARQTYTECSLVGAEITRLIELAKGIDIDNYSIFFENPEYATRVRLVDSIRDALERANSEQTIGSYCLAMSQLPPISTEGDSLNSSEIEQRIDQLYSLQRQLRELAIVELSARD